MSMRSLRTSYINVNQETYQFPPFPVALCYVWFVTAHIISYNSIYRTTSNRSPQLLLVQVPLTSGLYPGRGVYFIDVKTFQEKF